MKPNKQRKINGDFCKVMERMLGNGYDERYSGSPRWVSECLMTALEQADKVVIRGNRGLDNGGTALEFLDTQSHFETSVGVTVTRIPLYMTTQDPNLASIMYYVRKQGKGDAPISIPWGRIKEKFRSSIESLYLIENL